MGKEIVSYEQRMKDMTREYQQQEKISGSFISLRQGILRYGEQDIPGNQMVAIVLDAIHEHNYFDRDYDPDLPLPPTCYALGRNADEMAPDEMPDDDYFQPQADACKTCDWNEFGTSVTGRGKACQQRRRLAIMLAGEVKAVGRRWEPEIFEYIEDYEQAEIAMLKLPVTSVRNFSKYVQFIGKQYDKPPMGVITHIYVEPDPATQFKVHFDVLDTVPEELYEVLFQRRDEADAVIWGGYQAPPEDVKKSGRAKGAKGVRAARRKREKEE